MNTSNYTAGYSLVEALIAITILLLAIAGPMTIASKGLQSSFFARDQLTASMLAQEGIESIIALRNENLLYEYNQASPDFSYAGLWAWADPNGDLDFCFTDDGDEGCNLDVSDEDLVDTVVDCGNIADCLMDYDPSSSGRAHYSFDLGGTAHDSPFNRVIKLREVQPDKETEVEVTVSWYPTIFGGTPKSVTLRTELFNTYGN